MTLWRSSISACLLLSLLACGERQEATPPKPSPPSIPLPTPVSVSIETGPAVVSSHTFTHQVAGQQVVETRSVLADGRVQRFARGAEGQLVDIDALKHAGALAAWEQRGHMAPTLLAQLEEVELEERLQVAFWLRVPREVDLGARLRRRLAEVPRGEVAAAVRAERLGVMAVARELYAPGNERFAEALVALGGDPLLIGDVWPVVIASVTAAQARELSRHPRVDQSYLSQPEWYPEGANAQGTMRSRAISQALPVGDLDVKVLVNDSGLVQDGHPFLPRVIQLNQGPVQGHATAVAGNICNNHPFHRAAAFRLREIYSGWGRGDLSAPRLWGEALARGVDLGNCSYWNGLQGRIEFLDRFFDETIRTFSVMMFKSNGNRGDTAEPSSTSPGNGYNSISVGNFSDRDDSDWQNDSMAPNSSYQNPWEGHEKPELVSPGQYVTTTALGGGLRLNFNGSSSSSPLACGVGALLAGVDDRLLAQPTTLKAILMASAWHDVEGSGPLSDRDGAGGIDASQAHADVLAERWWHGEVTDQEFPGDVFELSLDLQGGRSVRVIALWFSNANAFLDALEMDLDLTVLDPDGQVVASSVSNQNPFELVQFDPSQDGTYSVRLTRQRFDGLSEPLTVAWSVR